MRSLAVIALLSAITPALSAQRTAAAFPHFSPPPQPVSPVTSSRLVSRPAFDRLHRFNGMGPFRSLLYPLGILSDALDSDALASLGYPVASQPPVIMMQAPPAANPVAVQAPSPAQPLMIELQGDRYVRISGGDNSGAEIINQPSSPAPLSRSLPPTHTVAAPELAPAALIFRDGHREEVSDYTIADGILYARGNYYADGSWNRKIELTALNLPETIKVNDSRGVHFQLPTAPNEVVTRP